MEVKSEVKTEVKSEVKNAKNRLQEIYQKRQQDVPTYNSVNLSGISSEPAWRAQVVTCDGHSVWSRQFSKKTHAENDAAEKCLILINRKGEEKKAKKYVQPDNPRVIILLDLENVPLSARTRLSTPEADVRIIGFVGKYNRGILKDREQIETMMELVIADCTGADAADHAMTFSAGQLSCQYKMRGTRDNVEQSKKIKWFLVSSDQFAAVPVEFLRKNGYVDSHSVTNLDDLKRQLPELIMSPP
jgi:hypothetical protein